MKSQKVNRTQLAEILRSIKGTAKVTMTALVDARLAGGKSCPFHGARKLCRVIGLIGYNYKDNVDTQRGREEKPLNEAGEIEEFVPAARKVGHRVTGTPLVYDHRSGHYHLDIRPQHRNDQYVNDRDEIIPIDQIAKYLYRNPNEGANQGVDKPIRVRQFRLDHIVGLTVNGVDYEVTPKVTELL